MRCPVCNQATTPTLEIVVETCLLGEIEAAILAAVWRGKGQPVPTERIYQAMYPLGSDRPSTADMWDKFKFGLHRLRRKLVGSGVWVENCGYQRGYRVTFTASSEVAA